MKLKLKYLFNDVKKITTRLGDSGYDLSAYIRQEITIEPRGRVSLPTGIAVELVDIPAGFDVELQVRPRSGHTQRGIVAQFGTIDSSYRGEIWVTLFNFTDSPIKIEPDERIAQLVVCPIFKPDIIITKELSSTDLGDKGFGSTGNK